MQENLDYLRKLIKPNKAWADYAERRDYLNRQFQAFCEMRAEQRKQDELDIQRMDGEML